MVIENQQPKVKIVILRIKDKYLICEDKGLKKYIGKILLGEIKR